MADWDVVVVGGGAAGLSAGLTLARARRRVVVVDAGEPRNAPAAGVHGFLTRDGVAPMELVRLGRAEVEGVGGTVIPGRAVGARRLDEATFEVTLGDGTVLPTRRLLLAAGLVDELPAVPGLAEHWGRSVVHCPYCHGYEVRDQPIAVLSTGPLGVHHALLWRQWSAEVALVLHSGSNPTDDELAQLTARGVTVVRGPVSGVETDEHGLAGLRLPDGAVHRCRVVAVATRMNARDDLARALGAAVDDIEMGGHVVGRAVRVDALGATTVPGVWAAGNVATVHLQVITAAGAGVMAGAGLNADLIAEDVRIALRG